MVVDNCPAHPNTQSSLKAIKLVFLPPNTTSKSQPCDQGIIQNMKLHYRKQLVFQLICSIEAKKEFQFNLLDALYTLRFSWDAVTPSTLSGCFKHCGFVKESSIEHGDENVSTHDEDMSELNEVLASVSNEVSLDDYLEVDEQVVTSEFMSDDDIVESIQDTNSNLDNVNDTEGDVEEPRDLVTLKEAQGAVVLLRHFFEQHDEADFDIVMKLYSVIQNYAAQNMRQKQITEYFKVRFSKF